MCAKILNVLYETMGQLIWFCWMSSSDVKEMFLVSYVLDIKQISLTARLIWFCLMSSLGVKDICLLSRT